MNDKNTQLKQCYLVGGAVRDKLLGIPLKDKDYVVVGATAEQMARDVTEFLAWAGDPKMEVRKNTGFATLLYLLIFGFLTFATYKTVWRNVKH